jgi:3-hydroxyisobutyrate dehydrogenase
MFGAINAITVEILAAAARLGLDPRVLFQTIVESGAATVSNLFREIGPKILEEDWSATFSLALLEKDNRLGLEMSEAAGARMQVARAVQRLNSDAVAHGLGRCDTSALIQLLRDDRGAQETPPA